MMKPSHEAIVVSILDYLKTKTKEPVTPDTNLFSAGVLDSMEVMEMIYFLETKFEIEVDPEEIAEENFRTAEAIVAMMEKKTQ